ncbi:MAG TPA: NADH-quinone oxidoreductase subunit E [Rhizobiaceae bacterium]|nr:NADH-quinone oxidoreductase subunit E [Rhizobiaceae bacterium]
MSVRRLAEIQPESFAFTQANMALANEWIAKYPEGRQQSAVIPLLMIAQDQEGWVTKPAIEYVAKMLDMPLIRVLEVATFYTQYQLSPVGTRAHVQVCGTTPCMLMGAGELMDVCRSKIHPEQFHTNADGTLSWEEVECLGACVNAPMVMIFKDTYEDLTPERLGEIIDAFEAGNGASIKPGTQIDRISSAPIGGLTSLKDEQAILKPSNGKGRDTDANVPPSKSARPDTHAEETGSALKSPSPKKTSEKAENAKSVPPLPLDKTRANQTVDDAGAPGRQRKSRPANPDEKKAEYKSPELMAGQPIGPDGKEIPGAQRSGGGPLSAIPSLDSPDRPIGIEKPGKPDDLKLISGVGPKIEHTLNDLGIYTFAQIASWKKAQRNWIDAYLSFHGRVERDDWVKQAKALAKGGEAEYIRVFGKKPR